MNHGDKSKSKNPVFTPASASTQDLEPFNKAKKDKKKKQYRDKRNSKESRDTPASRINITEVGNEKKRRKEKDPREVTCYNYNKLEHYADQYPEPWKPKN